MGSHLDRAFTVNPDTLQEKIWSYHTNAYKPTNLTSNAEKIK